MNRIIFPALQLKEATMEEVVELFRIKSREYDTLEKDPAKKGVNFIFKPGTTAPALINLDLKDVPLAEVLKYATELAGMKYKVEAYAVVISSPESQTEMYTRTFRVPPDFLSADMGQPEQIATDYLKALGIPFPEGASASCVPGSSQLRVRNTQQGLEMLEMMFEALQGYPPVGAWGSIYYAEKLRRIVLPSLTFREATLDEAIEYLHAMGQDCDIYEKDAGKKGFNFVLKPDAAAQASSITLDLKEVPMAEALKYVTELAGVKYKLEPYAVVIIPRSEADTELTSHIFKVPPNFLTLGGGPAGSTAMDVLKAEGVQFAEGGSAALLPDPSLLMVRNNLHGLYEVDSVIENLKKHPIAAPPVAGSPVNKLAVIKARVAQTSSSTPPSSSLLPAAQLIASGGAAQLLRDAEQRALLRHFESTVADIADREKAATVEDDPARQSVLKVQIAALRGWKDKLVVRITELETAPKDATANLRGAGEPVSPGITGQVAPQR